MLDPSKKELISAHVDGQLTPDEQRAAERLLGENPQARQLNEELCALGRRIAELPRHRLEAGFAAAVLRASERALLLGANESPVYNEVERETEPSQPAQPLSPRRDAGTRVWRPVVWFVAGAAAAVLVMLAWPLASPSLTGGNDPLAQNSQGNRGRVEGVVQSKLADDQLTTSNDEELQAPALGIATEANVENGSQAALDSYAIEKAAPTPDAVDKFSFSETPVDRTEESLELGFNAPGGRAAAEHVSIDVSEDIVLIQVRLTAAAARQQVVANVLRENGVAVEEARPQQNADARNRKVADLSREATRPEAVANDDAVVKFVPGDELLIAETSTEQLAEALAALATRDGVVAESRVGIPAAYFLPRVITESAITKGGDVSLAADSAGGAEASFNPDGTQTPKPVTAGAALEQTARQQGSDFASSPLPGRAEQKSRAYRMLIAPSATPPVANGRGAMTQPAGSATSGENVDRQSFAGVARDSQGETATAANAARQVRSIWVLRVTPETAEAPAASDD